MGRCEGGRERRAWQCRKSQEEILIVLPEHIRSNGDFFSKETVPPTPSFSFPSLLLILSSFHAVVVLIGKEESSQLAAKNQADALQLKMVQG